MIYIFFNRFFHWLFQRRKNQLLFLRTWELSFTYSSKDVWTYCSFKRAIKRAKKHRNCNLVIQSYYNGLHYPVIDMDNSNQLTKALTAIESQNIPYALIQSSINHYWIILDYGRKDFYEANTILHKLGTIFGDRKYFDMAFEQKRYCIRAFYERYEVDRLPIFVSQYDIPALKTTEYDDISKSTATGAWRTSYYQKQGWNSAQYSENFSKFIQDLRDYYTNKCQLFSVLLT